MRIQRGDVAVITGAASGIGRATALALAKRGCSLVLGDLDGDGVAAVASLASERYGVSARGQRCDVRSDEDVARLFAHAGEENGRIDIAILNAGTGYYSRVDETPVEQLARLFDVNVLGVQRGVLAVSPAMRAQGRGAIVITGSVNGRIAWPYHGAYSATKFALTGLAQALRMELAGTGVQCTLVLPANVQTRFYAAAATLRYEPAPIGPAISPAKVARAIVGGIERGAREVYAGPPLIGLTARAGQLLPGLTEFAGRRWLARRERGSKGGG